MSFFSKLADAVTGGGVKVGLQWSEAALGKPVEVKVTAVVADRDRDIAGVYLLILADEKVIVHNVKIFERIGDQIQEKIEDVTETVTTFSQKVALAGAQTLKAGQNCEWTGSFVIPADKRPSYTGVNAKHAWQIKAGLDAKGNDPDSGWFEIPVGP